jgi:hypothetical protein
VIREYKSHSLPALPPTLQTPEGKQHGKIDFILIYSLPCCLFRRRKPGPVGQVRDKWLCLGGLSLKIQIPSTKLQINLKLQYSMTKTFQGKTLFGYSNFGHWDLFDIWNFNNAMKFQQNKSPLGLTKARPSGPGSLQVISLDLITPVFIRAPEVLRLRIFRHHWRCNIPETILGSN